MMMLLAFGLAKREARLVAADFESEVGRRHERALRLDVDAYRRDRVPFLLVDAFDAGEIANDRVRGPQRAVRKLRPSLRQPDAAEVGVLDLRTEGPDQRRDRTDARRANSSGYLAIPVRPGVGKARDRADQGVVHHRLSWRTSLRRSLPGTDARSVGRACPDRRSARP